MKSRVFESIKTATAVSINPAAPHREEWLDNLPDQARLNVDETGHKQNGQRQWTWCFRVALDTLFKLGPTRSGDVLMEVLGAEFNGAMGCDDFSA